LILISSIISQFDATILNIDFNSCLIQELPKTEYAFANSRGVICAVHRAIGAAYT